MSNYVKVLGIRRKTTEISHSLEKASTTYTEEIKRLQSLVAELQQQIDELVEPRVLTVEEREHVLIAIAESLSENPPVISAQIAASTYDKKFFDRENDPLFKRDLAKYLFNNFGGYSASAASVGVWNAHQVL